MIADLGAVWSKIAADPVAFCWVAFGLAGQGVFFARFLVQLIASERRKQSVVPIAFWYISIVGGIMLFAYAIRQRDIVFILGQGGGVLIYVRNLVLIYRHRARMGTTADPTSDKREDGPQSSALERPPR
jgi:lipid-A-disaccharide synthase-like uncharacterized protein